MNKTITSQSKTGYLEQLTWLRGVAAFFVIISHVIRATEVSYLPQNKPINSLFLNALDLGTFGVLLFFTLSGTTLYISHANKPAPIYHFYIKRIFRILPAFSVSLLFYILFQPIFSNFYPELQGFWIEKQFVTPFSKVDILQYLLLMQNSIGTMGLFNNAYWSLPVEFQYYLIFPLLILSLKYLNILGPMLIGLLLYLLYKFDLSHFVDTKVFMLGFSFCGGVIIGKIYTVTRQKKNFSSLPFATIILIISFVIASLISNEIIQLPNYPIISGIWNWYILLSFISVSSVLFGKIYLYEIAQKALRFSGNTSYSAYLYHNLIISILILICINLSIAKEFQLIIVLAGAIIGTYCLANISFNLIEQKGIKIGQQLCSYLKTKKNGVNTL